MESLRDKNNELMSEFIFQTEKSGCASNPCQNGGQCVERTNYNEDKERLTNNIQTQGNERIECLCLPLKFGEFCELGNNTSLLQTGLMELYTPYKSM